MKKPFPGQQKCLFMPLKCERILINPLRRPIFPVNLNGDSKAHGILHLKPCSTNEPVLSADEGIQQVASFRHLRKNAGWNTHGKIGFTMWNGELRMRTE
jgi:hypothetical protein